MVTSQPQAVDPAILERVRVGLQDRDWSGVTLAELARLAGMSRMTLHRRALSKEVVLEHLRRRLQAEQDAALLGPLSAVASARERLGAALEAICQVDERYLGVLSALAGHLDAVVHEPGPSGQPVLTRRRFTDPIHRLLVDGGLDGSIVVDDPETCATLLLNAVGHTYRHLRTGHHWPPDEARQRVVALVLDGLPPRRP